MPSFIPYLHEDPNTYDEGKGQAMPEMVLRFPEV
jgi:hypothetical protein